MIKNLPTNSGDIGDTGLIPGSGRSVEEGNGNPLQYFRFGNPMDREAWRVTVHGVAKESDTTERLNNKEINKYVGKSHRALCIVSPRFLRSHVSNA